MTKGACYAERESSDLPDGSSPTGTTRAPDVAGVLADIAFRDPEGARRHLTRTFAQITPTLAEVLPGLLAESPDVDSALLLFERLAGQSEALRAEFSGQPVLAHYAILVFGYSRYLGETLFREPGLLQGLHAEGQFHRGFSSQDFADNLTRFQARDPERDVSLLLARFKKREYVRILLRDVLRIATIAETTAEISALSDVLVQAALREAQSTLERRLGVPSCVGPDGRQQRVPFAVLGMGKLGGNELNYSSDIDVLYLHGDGEDDAGARRSRHEHFIRLAQHVTELLSRVTEEGPVFRIDLRLRPQGRDGELAVALSQALQYYRQTAEDWERQALLKVRAVAGDMALAREFIRGVQAFVYTRDVNFAAVKTALVSREKMLRHRAKSLAGGNGEGIDVKLDHGGIRDIEFLVQCLQRVYGGSEPWLRSGGTLFSLHKLHDKGHLGSRDFQELTTAYEFLRQVEHRLQLRYGQQTHRVPSLPEDLRILERALTGFGVSPAKANLETHLRQRMAEVSAIYKRVIFQQQVRAEERAGPEAFVLRSAPIGAPDASTQVVLERLSVDAPQLYELAIRKELSSQTRRNLLAFFSAAFTGSLRYGAILRHAPDVEKALEIFGASAYLTDVLIRHPEEIATLAEVRGAVEERGTGFLFGGPLEPGNESGDPVFVHLANSQQQPGERLSLLRRHYRHRTLIEGVRDLSERRGVYNSLGALTAVADDAIAAACGVVGIPSGWAVLALGSVGSREFDVSSDADLLFVREESLDAEPATRAAERLIQALAAYTQDGTVFPVDTRLRPRGAEGELVVTLAQLAGYFSREAQAWEVLSFGKLRFVAGDRGLGDRVIQQTRVLFERFSRDEAFGKALAMLRQKLEGKGDPNFKNAQGGLYDIEYLSGLLLVERGYGLVAGTMRDSIWRCADAGLLSRGAAAGLDRAAELIRSVDHCARLVTGRSQGWLPANETARETTFKLAGKMLDEKADRLEGTLKEAQVCVRATYQEIFGSRL